MYVRNVLKHGGSLAVVIPARITKALKISYPCLLVMRLNKDGKLEMEKFDDVIERGERG